MTKTDADARAEPRDPSDADVRRQIRANAIQAAKIQAVLMEPILDPRAFGGEVPNASDVNRLLHSSGKALDTWAKTVEVNAPPQDFTDAEKREQTKRLLRERPAALLELAREAGVEIRALAIAGALTVGSQETDGTESDP